MTSGRSLGGGAARNVRRGALFVAVGAVCAFAALAVLGSHGSFRDPHGPRRGSPRAPPCGPVQAGCLPASAPAAGYGEESPAVLRLVTFNIEYGEHVERAAREILSDAELSRADVVTVQEVSGRETEVLAARLGMQFVYYPATLRDDDEFGNAVLSRFPIISDWKLVLPHEPWFGGGVRIAVGAELERRGAPFVVYSVHNETFVSSPGVRLDQVRAIVRDAGRWSVPTVVAGDFNTMDRYSRERTIRTFSLAGFAEATRGVGVTAYQLGGFLGAPLDHVFVRGFAPTRAGSRPTRASDHKPVYVELALPAESREASAPARGGDERREP